MSERITEAELQEVERTAGHDVNVFCSLYGGHYGRMLTEKHGDDSPSDAYFAENALRLVAEVRRLRRLIADHVPPYEFGFHDLAAEAEAIRAEHTKEADRA